MINDLREFIDTAQQAGELKVIEGADSDLEISVISELMIGGPNPPLILFDKIKGHEPGYRVAANLFTSPKRMAMALGLPLVGTKMDLVRAMRDRIKTEIKLRPPEEVTTGPITENVDTGDKIDLFKFPAPQWHELDGGKYIGTGSIAITRDPDDGWVNFGTYRTQIQDKNTVTVHMVEGHHGAMIRKKYWERGLNCPIAVCCGQEPILFAASAWEHVPWGVSEYDFAGGLKGEPIKIIRCATTGLPIPATAEIVIEGEIVPWETETRIEGPFGEWWGYYGGGRRPQPACRVKSVMYRNNPIIQGNPPSVIPSVWTLGRHIQKSASLWAELDKHLPGVKGVWMVEEASIHAMPVISIKQQYQGHAKQALLIAAGCGATGWGSRIIMVVDDDIDPSNISEVIWALATRTDPEKSIDVIRDCWDSVSDPLFSPENKRLKQEVTSRALINACKPYWWIDKFPPSIKTSPELLKQVKEKWGHVIGG